jgi:hypothetical protein
MKPIAYLALLLGASCAGPSRQPAQPAQPGQPKELAGPAVPATPAAPAAPDAPATASGRPEIRYYEIAEA